jgi:hypothetical protein
MARMARMAFFSLNIDEDQGNTFVCRGKTQLYILCRVNFSRHNLVYRENKLLFPFNNLVLVNNNLFF